MRQCLLELSASYQLVAYTASDKLYADAILDFIEGDEKLFSARLYRQHCVSTEFGLVKDLRIIANRSMKDLVIIDNSALSFAFNVNNGIPILPFYDNHEDEELRHLTFYLTCLQQSQVDDIRAHNEEAFGLYRLATEHETRVTQPKGSPADDCSPHTRSKEYL